MSFNLVDDPVIGCLFEQFPCREHQIRTVATLTHPNGIRSRNLVIHGPEASGKTAITGAVLLKLSEHCNLSGPALKYVTIDATQCITTRHLFERIIDSVKGALNKAEASSQRCDSMAQLAVSLSEILGSLQPPDRFVLVLDGVDRLMDAPATLLPALSRLPEMLPCLTNCFIVTSPSSNTLRSTSCMDLHFTPYSKSDYVQIMSLSPPDPIPGTTARETNDLWARFCAAVHDSLIKSAARSLHSFTDSCQSLWPRFIAPIVAGTYEAKEFSKILVAARVHFQDETLLNPSIISANNDATDLASNKPAKHSSFTDISSLLPTTARLLLLSAYLASHNAPKYDLVVFSTYHHGKKRRRGGGMVSKRSSGVKQRKIAKKLLGLHSFVFERMMAIFESVRIEWAEAIGPAGVDGDVGMALMTLTSLRLLVKVGAGEITDRSGKWRVNVAWDAIRAIGRSIGVDVEEWLVE